MPSKRRGRLHGARERGGLRVAASSDQLCFDSWVRASRVHVLHGWTGVHRSLAVARPPHLRVSARACGPLAASWPVTLLARSLLCCHALPHLLPLLLPRHVNVHSLNKPPAAPPAAQVEEKVAALQAEEGISADKAALTALMRQEVALLEGELSALRRECQERGRLIGELGGQRDR